jgi:predicted transcriptional regulator
MAGSTSVVDDDLLELTSAIVKAYVGHNAVSPTGIPDLIRQTHAALQALYVGEPIAVEAVAVLKPAVPVKKSVTPDFIICLEDGKEYKSLKRHLRAAYAMTPEEYRAKWDLPDDYPMVAPNYSATRSTLAKNIGLGRNTEEMPRRRRKTA